MNFKFEVSGFMPIIAELQLHLRHIYEIKVRAGVDKISRSILSSATLDICCFRAQHNESHFFYEIARAKEIAALIPQEVSPAVELARDALMNSIVRRKSKAAPAAGVAGVLDGGVGTRASVEARVVHEA